MMQMKCWSSDKNLFIVALVVSSFANGLNLDDLDELLLRDIIPNIGSKCQSNYASIANVTTSSSTFDHTESPSFWHPIAVDFEKDLFLAEMSHSNENDSRQAWTIRIGKGSNIYSFRGDYGEAIPPQYHVEGIYVDEVMQSVSVNQLKNVDEDGLRYFIHQAGTYQKDPDLVSVNNPFFSPNIAKYCSSNGRECLFGSWGQQAHIPMAYRSDMLYFNGYRDCGGGVMEFITVMHNAAKELDSSDSVSYLNVPWGGTRRKNLRDLLISNTQNQLEHIYPLPIFDDVNTPHERAMTNTGGFATYAQHINASDAAFDRQTFEMPSGLNLVVGPKLTVEDAAKSLEWDRPCYMTHLQQTVAVNFGCQFCSLFFSINNSVGVYRFYVPVVIHWAYLGEFLFYCEPKRDPNDRSKREDAHLWKLNKHLLEGTTITVTLANDGKPWEDNTALTFVHGFGKTNIQWAPSRLRYGYHGGARRDYNVYTHNARSFIEPGSTYISTQYMITGALDQMESIAPTWVDQTFEDIYPSTELDGGATIRLFSHDANKFGISVDDRTTCLQGTLRCVGKTLPEHGTSPLFSITCDTVSYIGSDRYHFSPSWSDGEIIRSYACDGLGTNRPAWKLLGFFPEGSCDFLTSAVFDDTFCSTSLPPTPSPSQSPSLSANPSLSMEPSSVPSQNPSLSMQPSPSALKENDEWYLGYAEIINISSDFMSIKHALGSYSESIQNVTLWYSDFSERIDQTQELLTLKSFTTASSSFTYDVAIDTKFVHIAPSKLVQYENSNEFVGIIQFGSVVTRELHKSTTNEIFNVAQIRSTFTLKFDLRYDITDSIFSLTEVESGYVTTSLVGGAVVAVCLCMNEDDFECLSDDVDLTLRMNDYVQVCFTPESEIYEIQNLEMTLESLDGTLRHKPISFGANGPILDPFTTRKIGQQGSNDNYTTQYKILLLAELFQNNNEDLVIKGLVFMNFNVDRKQDEFKQFSLRILLGNDIETVTVEETSSCSGLVAFILYIFNTLIELF